ncbi:MAG: type II secretion system secretin GspD [Candidatus Eremiobacterota bacterium]
MGDQSRIKGTIALLVLLGVLLGSAGRAFAQPPPPKDPLLPPETAEQLRRGRLLMNYESIEIKDLAKIMAALTGRNIVVDDRVAGKITVLSSREVTPAEAWDLFKAALSRYGFAIRDRGSYIQIMPKVDARRTAPVVKDDRGARYPRTEDPVLALLILKQANPDILQNAVRPLLSESGFMASYLPGKALIVADQADVVSRVAELARYMDRLSPKQHFSIVFPQYAEADKVVPVLQQLFAKSGTDLTIQAFAPANAVMIQGSEDQIRQIKKLLTRIDIPTAAPEVVEKPQFFVYSLQNAKAEDVAKILSEMLQERKQQEQQAQQSQGQSNVPAATPSPTPTPGATPDVNQPFPTYAANATGKPDRPKSVPFVSSKVAADPETNSLVLFISPSEYANLVPVISKLDLARKQILVTAVVAEVSLGRLLQQGANFQVITPNGVLSAFNGGVTEEGLLSFLASGNFLIGAVSGNTRTINVGGRDVQVPEAFGLISGIKEDSDFNLISAPRVLTEDHKEAEMNVGQVIPFATGARFDTFGQPLVTYDYREVGITLKVVPHVSQSNRIRMEIDQKIQEVTDFLQQNLGGFGYVVPIISNRNVNTTVTMQDGQTLMIGGLISKKTVETMRKVPILGDIPLIGTFFKETRKDEDKTTLFISITPHIVEDPQDLSDVDRPYKVYLEGEQNPGEHQTEPQPTKAADPEDPYHTPERPPGKTGAGLWLTDVRFDSQVQAGGVGLPVVSVTNQRGDDVEVVLVGSLTDPEGRRTRVSEERLKLDSGEEANVSLPALRFPDREGIYEFDVSAYIGEELVARLPVPRRLKLEKDR